MVRPPHEVLEIDPNAFEEDIQRAFREKAKRLHPDQNSDPRAREMFIELRKARQKLLDPNSQQQYTNKTRYSYDSEKTQSNEKKRTRDNTQHEQQGYYQWLIEAIKYPQQSDEWLKTIFLGGSLTFAALLADGLLLGLISLAVFSPTQGYCVRVIRFAATDENNTPKFDDWLNLTVEGLQFMLLSLGYPVIIIAFLGKEIIDAYREDGHIRASSQNLISGALILGFVFYSIPAGLYHFSVGGSIGSAFEPDVLDGIINPYYVLFLVLVIVCAALLWMVSSFISYFVGSFVAFYIQISLYYLLGNGSIGADITDELK